MLSTRSAAPRARGGRSSNAAAISGCATSRRCPPRRAPIKEAARTVMRHRDGILAWFDSQIANGLIEGINSLVQAAKAKARGYRSTRTLKAITYLIAGKLDLKLPT